MNRRNIIIGFILIALLGGGFVALGGGSMLTAKPTPAPAADVDELENLVTASGTLLPAKHASLAFKLSGQINQVATKAGASAKKGDVLIRVAAAELEAAVGEAQAAAALARANLNQLSAGASKEEIAAAQANVETAKAQLAKVRAHATVEEVAIVKAGLDRAAAELKDAQSAYDKVRNDPQVGMYPQSAALQLAYQEYQIAEARFNQVVKGASAEDIRVAEAGVAAAQANLDRVKASAGPEEIAAAQAHVDQAQASLQRAQAALASTVLVAPFDGLVVMVNAEEGETVAPGVPVLTLGDVSHLRLETDDLSETNIPRVRLGQVADVAFEALPGRLFKGKVTDIAPISTPKQGGTNYTVTIELNELDPALRWGMTGHVEINTK